MDVFFGRFLERDAIKELITYTRAFFNSLFSTLNEKMIHQCCINVLLTEVYKYLNGYSPDLMNKVFYQGSFISEME